ncbi:aldo/keto reductase [Streptomyces wuyuanensis]|uniref:aldo/keto reductase n=1 Tax=Streptomyces wuyuanensis TaxID=1196353 RepID=UPI0037A6D77A
MRAGGLDHYDVLKFHVWSDDWVGRDDWLDTIAALKQEGKIRLFGVSVNDHRPDSALALVRSGAEDTVQVIYNVFDQAPADALLPACEEHGVGVIVRVALDEGGLTGRITAGTTFPEGDWRNRCFRGDRPAQVEQRVAAIVRRSRHRTRRDRGARTAVRAEFARGLDRGPRDAFRAQRRAQHGGERRASAHRRAIDVLARHRWQRNFCT